ncbi:MAG TPA: glycoside hydrolase N-terminal domain-containing protein, partial [Vicinamibacterales bacterium]|nr:glycoside hydrolase N-terminal domain-containing protein [Vicinamibacterales bacterium]
MRYITAAWLAASAVFGVLVFSAQQPPAPRLTGAAQPPPSQLSLWYRAPASDRPLDPPGASGRGANQEWVRALPVGNGRLGAMVFGGVVHERLQLNEDTLWAGRPYDPVNPEARGALPEVRRLLASGRYRD